MNTVRKSRRFAYIASGLFMFLLVIYVRSYSFNTTSWIIWSYSLVAASYFCSRILAALFYKSPSNKNYNKRPTVAFIIPAYNEKEAIYNTIRRCFEVNYPKDKLEVIVINDCSTDSTWAEIMKAKKKFPKLRAINFSKNKGKREGMAAGIRSSKSEIYIQLDSDSYLEKNSLVTLVSGLEDRKIAGVTAHVDPANKDENVLTRMQTAYYFLSFRFHKAGESTLGLNFCCSGCCSAYRREYVLPLLDEWLNEKHLGVKTFFGDDRALTNLLLKEGFDTAYCDKAQAYTITPTKVKEFFKQQLRWKKGWIIGTTTKTTRFILKRDAFVGMIYIFPQILMNFLAPVVIGHAFFVVFFNASDFLFLYVIGAIAIYIFYLIYFSVFRQDEYRPYIFLWGATNIFLSTVIFVLALITLKDNGWGTR